MINQRRKQQHDDAMYASQHSESRREMARSTTTNGHATSEEQMAYEYDSVASSQVSLFL